MENVRRRVAQYRKAWRMEIAEARLYRTLAERESQAQRRAILVRMAEMEDHHAERCATVLRGLGADTGVYREGLRDRIRRWMILRNGADDALSRLEATEEGADGLYKGMYAEAESEEEKSLLHRLQTEERAHSRALADLANEGRPPGPTSGQQAGQAPAPAAMLPPAALPPTGGRLQQILGQERWHMRGGGWLGQAIYGLNDGLGAAFGVVSGVAGATSANTRFVLVSGLATALASALSMGSGAYLSTKSERELVEAELDRERQEIRENPEEEMEEMELFYQLKGFSAEESHLLASRLAEKPEQLLKTLAHEELGLSETSFPNPWRSTASATISTAIGAVIPVLPYFFASGFPALVTSFIVSTAAHFGVGAAKVVVTGRSWLKSGLEMMMVGLGEAAITYLIGVLISPLLG